MTVACHAATMRALLLLLLAALLERWLQQATSARQQLR
jgi:hypothetical protein